VMKEKIKLLLLDVLGINAIFRLLNRDKALILMYHGICNDGFDLLKGYDERHVSKSCFRKQLSYLKQIGYTFVTMTRLVETLKNRKQPKKLAVLTFDDGFRNVIENAYPVMQEMEAKGCFYLITDLIGKDKLLWTDYVETIVRSSEKGEFSFIFEGNTITYILDTKESYEKAMLDIKRKLKRMPDEKRKESLRQFDGRRLINIPKEFTLCDWKDVRKLDRQVLEAGSHTASHPNCTKIVLPEALEYEIGNSKLEIEKRTEYQIDHFCYPIGAHNDEVMQYVKKCGYQSAVTTVPGFNDENTPLFKLKRIAPKEDFQYFRAVVSGSYFTFTRM
jgi:peptidoglycan/xylan/chitin deacetylase (PgdA/CDA1 family)